MSKKSKGEEKELDGFEHPYNHGGGIPEVSPDDIDKIIEEDGPHYKVRMKDGSVAIVDIAQPKKSKSK